MQLARLPRTLGLNRTVIALSLVRMGDGVGNSILFIILPLYVAQLPHRSLDLPVPLLVGVLLSAYGFAAAAVQPAVAIWVDRFGHYKRTIQAGLLLIGGGTFSFLYAHDFLELLGLRIAQGAGLALAVPATMALLTVATDRPTRGGAMGFFTTMRMLGLAVGPMLGGWLHVQFGFAGAFYVGTGVLLGALLLVQFTVRPAPAVSGAERPPGYAAALRHPGLLSAAASTFLMASAFTLVTTLQNEFDQRLGITAFGFSIAFSALMIGRLLFQMPLGHLSDRIGRRAPVVVGLLVLGAATVPLGAVGSLFELGLLRFVQGLAAAAIVAPAMAYAGDVAQQGGDGQQGRATSLVTIGFGLGIGFGPLLAGVLGSIAFDLPFWVDGALCAAGALAVHRWMR